MNYNESERRRASMHFSFLPLLSTERRENYNRLKTHFLTFSNDELCRFAPGMHTLNNGDRFYVKRGPFMETVVHVDLTAHALAENYGGIILCYLQCFISDANSEIPYSMFMEATEGEVKHSVSASRKVAHAVLWMHSRGVLHGDIANNNVFAIKEKCGATVIVAGDFGMSVYNDSYVLKREELLRHSFGAGAVHFSLLPGEPVVKEADLFGPIAKARIRMKVTRAEQEQARGKDRSPQLEWLGMLTNVRAYYYANPVVQRHLYRTLVSSIYKNGFLKS